MPCGRMRVTLSPSNAALIHFYKKIPGKWILAGEHTVLRGGDALVFPLNSQYLEIFYYKTDTPFQIRLEGVNSEEISEIVHSVFTAAFTKLKIARTSIPGTVRLKSNILFGAGMGASATLCVAVTEFFNFFGHLKLSEMYEFARELENIFHGESSGVDIAVVLTRKPLLFSREKGPREILNVQLPRLYLSHTGEKGITKDCVQKVKQLWIDDPKFAESIDLKMKAAVLEFSQILTEPHSPKWIDSLKKANSCFYDWNLVSPAIKSHEETLRASGAKAVKLTGSGAGGFMLSLWEKSPPANLPFNMISCTDN